MNMCMACHTTQDIRTTDDLIAYTKQLQNDASERYFQVRDTQKELRDAIIAAMDAGLSEELIQAARDAYSRGDYYLAYSKKTEGDYIQGAVPGLPPSTTMTRFLNITTKPRRCLRSTRAR